MVKVLLKILSHGLLIAFIVAAFFLYTNREELFPRWFEQSQAVSAPVEERRTEQDVAAVPAQEKAGATADVVAADKGLSDTGSVTETMPVVPVAPTQPQSSVTVAETTAGSGPDQALRFRPLDEESPDESVPPPTETPAIGPDSLQAAAETKPVYRPLEEDIAEVAVVTEPDGLDQEAAPAQEAQAAIQQAGSLGDKDEVSAPDTVVPGGDTPAVPVETAVGELTAAEQGVEEATAALLPASDKVVTVSSPDPADEAATEPPPTPEKLESDDTALDDGNRQPVSGTAASLEQRLETARTLYWQRDIGQAAEAYTSLGRDYPRDTALWGEIGNFYYSVRQLRPAAMAYYRTVSLLIDQGDTEQARRLLGVLYQLDANRARELDARLQRATH